MKTREEMSKEEMLADPIFLFQTRRVTPTEEYYFGDYDYCSDCEAVYHGTTERHEDEHQSENYEPPSDDELIKDGVLLEYWETRSVFYSREEGNEFGRKNSHNYDKWRVYSVPALGYLKEKLSLRKPNNNFVADPNNPINHQRVGV